MFQEFVPPMVPALEEVFGERVHSTFYPLPICRCLPPTLLHIYRLTPEIILTVFSWYPLTRLICTICTALSRKKKRFGNRVIVERNWLPGLLNHYVHSSPRSVTCH